MSGHLSTPGTDGRAPHSGRALTSQTLWPSESGGSLYRLALGVHEYHFVKRYLERQPALPLTLHQVDPLIRELQQYRDVIQLRLKESEAT